MHRGRYGRRVPPGELSLDADPPYWIPYYQRPLSTAFFYGLLPVVGPVGAPYLTPTVVTSTAQVGWGYSWVDPITTLTFVSYMYQIPIGTSPGVRIGFGVQELLTGDVLGGESIIGPVASYWDIIGNVGSSHTYTPTVAQGLFSRIPGQTQQWKVASWSEMPT